MLASLLLPALGRARSEAYRASCINNLKQMAQAAISYTDSNSGYYPYAGNWANGSTWDDLLTNELQTGLSAADCAQHTLSNTFAGRLKILICPEDKPRSNTSLTPRSYTINSGDNWWSPTAFTGVSSETARSVTTPDVAVPSNTLLIGERVNVPNYAGYTSYANSGDVLTNNGSAAHSRPAYYNYSFCDGHVEYAHGSNLATKRNR